MTFRPRYPIVQGDNIKYLIDKKWSLHDKQITSRFLGIGTDPDIWWFDSDEMELYRSQEQNGRNKIPGHKLKRELEHLSKKVSCIQILLFLLLHKDLIPSKWNGLMVCAWGHILIDDDKKEHIAFLYCNGEKSCIKFRRLSDPFDNSSPALTINCP